MDRFSVDESQFLLASLDGVGDPASIRGLIATGLAASPEAGIPAKEDIDDPAAYIAEQFRRFLGREVGAYELSAFVDEWETDEAVGPRTVIRALIASREYQTY